MDETRNSMSRQQQVKVVIRLKPQQQIKYSKCVYLSQLQNQLVVQTDLKKQIFIFDHVAHQSTTQLEIYKTIGKQAVERSFEGYNCSIFAYGQTGAGKTYSIMGSIDELQQNIYCESRGILPRLIEDIVQELNTNKDKKYLLTCSYIEIYNQQIFDLLSSDKRIHHIRQSKKGVFIQGIKECKLASYKQGIQLIMQGEISRKMAITTMNTQSSRSHVIFTIFIQSETILQDRITIKKSKLNIIDLAGSERIKHTNVQGQRLKQGCNINKSLHVLGNVINSLVQSTKKKKYIPYRDSKLTYYLKDSFGGNSITKVLANIHCSKQYFGDTLSTLMFAKRIKNLKMKVELNINESDNFNNLRQQVRRLREQLAQARYFKNQINKNNQSDLSITFQKVTTDNTDYDVTPKVEIIDIFTENQGYYKTLIQIYQEHMKECANRNLIQRRNHINKINQWKCLQNRNNALIGLIKRFPSFTKIYKENILLKQQKTKSSEEIIHQSSFPILQHKNSKFHDYVIEKQKKSNSYGVTAQQIIKKYEEMIAQIQQKFNICIETLERNYIELQAECKRKDKKIKQILKNSEISPQISQLQNENEYLHLNILNLQNEIQKLQQNESRLKIQNRQSKKGSIRHSKHQSFLSQQSEQQNDQDLLSIIQKLKQIHIQALKQTQTVQSQKKQMQHIINQLRNQINSLINQNNKLQKKYQRSKSRKSRSNIKFQNHSSSYMSPKQNELKIPKEQMFLSHKSNQSIQNEIKIIHQGYSKEIMSMKLDNKIKQKQIHDLRNQIDSFMSSDYKIEQQFGKGISEIIIEYRELLKKEKGKEQKYFRIPKSTKNINKQIDKRYGVTTKFDSICIGEDKDRKSMNFDNHSSKSKLQPFKRQQCKGSKGNSSTKNSRKNLNIGSKTNSFFHP